MLPAEGPAADAAEAGQTSGSGQTAHGREQEGVSRACVATKR